MAETLGVRPTEHGFEDVLLQCEVCDRVWYGLIGEKGGRTRVHDTLIV